ncbi:MAG: hypothetical protein GY826_10855, partial [Fuerstiella sp.]|nr:hypothetical protein [Fuerstiella sp.]
MKTSSAFALLVLVFVAVATCYDGLLAFQEPAVTVADAPQNVNPLEGEDPPATRVAKDAGRLGAMVGDEAGAKITALLRQLFDSALSDDIRLEGVTLELRDALGMPVTADDFLPGYRGDEAFLTSTDAAGFYEFTGLRAGTYHVYQQQPRGFGDGLDTAGSTGGQPINVADSRSEEVD